MLAIGLHHGADLESLFMAEAHFLIAVLSFHRLLSGLSSKSPRPVLAIPHLLNLPQDLFVGYINDFFMVKSAKRLKSANYS